jgi:membrane fusion protein (multidrug efflux system)
MPAREGDLIPADGVICKLDDEILSLRLVEEQAKLDGLGARHAELLAGTRKEELLRLEALLDEAKARLEQWKFEMQRVEKLYAGRDSNDKEFYDTRANYIAAQRRKAAAEAEYNLGVEGPRKEVIAQAAYAVAQQQAVVDRITADLANTVIHPPFAGDITARVVEVGEWVDVGDPVVEMAELVSVLVQIDVPESALPFLDLGDSVRVQVDALERSFPGRVRLIVRQARIDARTFPVAVEVGNSERLLASGMFARVTVPAGPSRESVAVPKDAVVEHNGVPHVAIVLPGRERGVQGMLMPVSVGLDVDEWITITSHNVQPGTDVITRGTERMLPFPTPVEIVDETGTPIAMPDSDNSAAPEGGA